MTPAALIAQAAAEGISLAISESGNIKARGAGEAIRRWEPVFRRRKKELLQALKGSALQHGLSAFNVEQFEERAAIIEYDGDLSREDAERLAATGQGYSLAAVRRWLN